MIGIWFALGYVYFTFIKNSRKHVDCLTIFPVLDGRRSATENPWLAQSFYHYVISKIFCP